MALRALFALTLLASPRPAQDVEQVREYIADYVKDTSAEGREELAELLLEEAEALFLFAGEGEDPAVGGAYVDAGFIALRHGLTPSEIPAAEFCGLGIELARARQNLGALYVFATNGARFAGNAGDVPAAKEFLLAAYPFDGVAPAYRATALTSLAMQYRHESRWEDGLRVLEEAEEALLDVPETEATYAQVYVLGERVENLIDQGALRAAARTLEHLETWVERTKDPELLGRAARHQVQLKLASGQFNSVVKEVRSLRETPLFELLQGSDRAAFLAMEAIALAAYARGSSGEAAALEEACAMLKRVRTEPGVEELMALQADLFLVDFALREDDIERAAAELALAQKRIEHTGVGTKSLEYGTRYAALALRVARRSGAEAEVLVRRKEALATSFEAFLQNWSAGRPDADIAFLRANTRRTIVVERITAQLGGGTKAERERAFEVLLDVQAHGSAWRASGRSAPGLAEVRAALADDHGLLVYLPAPEGGHVFAVDRTGVAHAALGPEDDAKRACRELDAALTRVASGAQGEGIEERLRSAAEACTRLLLDPVSDQLKGWSRVTVVGGEFFLDVPFEYLRDRSGAPLGEVKAVDAWPSVPRGLLLRKRAPVKSPASRLVLLVAANPEQAADATKLEPLPVTEADLSRLTAGLAKPQARRVLELTPARLAAEPLAGVPIVHIVAHAVYAEEGVVPGMTLVLESEAEKNGDGLFTRVDLGALPLSGLVLLSACEAARGRASWGDDRTPSLGGACLDAGARAVVQPRYPITYRQAVEVMGRVTKLIVEEKVAPAEALRRVRAVPVGEKRSEVERARLAGYRVLGLGHEPAWR